MKRKKIISVALSMALIASLGITSYAGMENIGGKYEFYGTEDVRGTFGVSVSGASGVTRNRVDVQQTILSVDVNNERNGQVRYKFDLPSGGIVSFALDGYGNKDDSFVIFDAGGRLIGYTNILKAVDANGNEIPANITVANNTIYQRFENNDMVKNVTSDFEIYTLQTTDVRANSFADNFSKSEWINREDGISLSLYPIYAFPTNASMYAAWDTVVSKHGRDSNWSNESGMKDQFHCHNDFASAKRPWNLEPWRPNVGYTATVTAGCNPS